MRDLQGEFVRLVNESGHPFHQAVLRACHKLADERRSEWLFQVSEYPVVLNSQPTRIDFVLRHRTKRAFLIAECKRANPSHARWCFMKAPYVRRNRDSDSVLIEQVNVDDGGNRRSRPASLRTAGGAGVYQLHLAVATGERGDGGGAPKDAIEQAVRQVLRGSSGFSHFLGSAPKLLPRHEDAYFIPVVFTTAQLHTSDVDVAAADIDTGTLTEAALVGRNWLWLEYPVGPELQDPRRLVHPSGYDLGDLASFYELSCLRTVAVVTPAGIEDFLSWISNALG